MLWTYKGLCWGLGLMFIIINESLRCKQGLSWEVYKESSSHTFYFDSCQIMTYCFFP
jgi:hypothetical protein